MLPQTMQSRTKYTSDSSLFYRYFISYQETILYKLFFYIFFFVFFMSCLHRVQFYSFLTRKCYLACKVYRLVNQNVCVKRLNHVCFTLTFLLCCEINSDVIVCTQTQSDSGTAVIKMKVENIFQEEIFFFFCIASQLQIQCHFALIQSSATQPLFLY